MRAAQRGGGYGLPSIWQNLGHSVLYVTLALLACSSAAQVSVSSSGSPSYSQPIAVPPGISGMQPNLSLMYAGGGVNGPAGHGWSVQGISMITRCPATRFTDAVPRGVKFDQNDKLCLDGQRLIQTDANGAVTSFPQTDDARGVASAWREYRTEKDSFARIRAYGIVPGSEANGPAYFKVWTKAGQIYEYGINSNLSTDTNAAIAAQGKTVVMVWAVRRVSDVVGNFIDFKYEVRDVASGSGPTASPSAGREWNIAEIQYTGNGAQAPTNKVIFRYSDRTTDRAEAYQQGSKNVSVRRLWAIDTHVNAPTTLGTGGVLVKRVRLAYNDSGVTKRSRLASIKECTDAAATEAQQETKCLPATTFDYSLGGSDAYSASTAFNLTTAALHNNTGANGAATTGVVPIDYDSDGKADLLVWSDTPAQNKLYRSNGDGSFTQVAAFNVTTEKLFSSDGCYRSVIADFNGDGLPDILRAVNVKSSSNVACASRSHLLYLSSGNGTFVGQTIAAGIALDKVTSTYSQPSCAALPGRPWTRTEGRYYYIADLNGDGFLDIATTVIPQYSWPCDEPPIPEEICLSIPCSTRLFLGSATGGFTEVTPANISNKALYRDPAKDHESKWPNGSQDTVDVDGDGIADLVSTEEGTWISRPGIGNTISFEQATGFNAGGQTCRRALDFNGDGRMDCLDLSATVTSNKLLASTGTAGFYASAFNLNSVGYELFATSGIGTVLLDINGDGRTDILRWKDDAMQNRVYLSNGDGRFDQSPTFNLTNSNFQLSHSDGTATFTIGDFLGNGTVQILRLKNNPTAGPATANQLYVKNDPTLPDQLMSVTSPTGIKSTLTYDSLARLAPPASAVDADLPLYRYYSDRRAGSPSAYPLIDLTIASPVVITLESDVGVGPNKVQTQFAYKGLKAAMDGRGMLGFRQSVQQTTAPNGEALSIWTDYLLDEPYAGVARRTETRRGAWNAPNAQLLSWITNTYCDRTSATNPDSATDTAPCATNARVRRPYLRKSLEQGVDLDGSTLPTVTTVNTYNDYGDPVTIKVTTDAAFAGATREYIKNSANTFCDPGTAGCPNSIAGDNWILGRLTRSTVTNTVPNLLAALQASPGNAPNASATSGSLPQTGSEWTFCAAEGGTCNLPATGDYTILYAPSSTSSQTATLNVTNVSSVVCANWQFGGDPAPGIAKQCFYKAASGTSTPPALSLSGCSNNSPTTAPTPATLSCTLSNIGQATANTISYGTSANTSANGPAGPCAGGTTCGTVTVTTGTTAGTYSGTLTATPNTGTAATQAFNMTVNAAASWTFCAAEGSTCNLPRTGDYTILYGPSSTSSQTATLNVTNVSSVVCANWQFGGDPAPGIAKQCFYRAAAAPTPPVLSLSGCSNNSPTPTPTPATMTCTLSNTGQTAASSISYSTSANTSASGPTGSCAGGSTCGTVTVTTGAAANTYSGTLTATPNTGTAATQTFSLTVSASSPPSVTASTTAITASSTFPTAAAGSVSFSNGGPTSTTLTFSSPAGTSVSPTTLNCPASAACGSVTVITGSAIGNYSGALGVSSSNGGSVPSVSVNMTVAGSIATLTSATALSLGTVLQNALAPQASWTFRNDGNAAMTLSLSALNSPFSVVSNSCSGVAPSATCSITARMATATVGTFSQTGVSITGASSGNRSDLSLSGTVNFSVQPFTYVSKTASATPSTLTATYTFRNNGTSAATVTARGYTSTYGPGPTVGGTCTVGAAVGANATCTVTVNATKSCEDPYDIAATLSNASGTTTGPTTPVPIRTGSACNGALLPASPVTE